MMVKDPFSEDIDSIKDVRQIILVAANGLIAELGYEQITMSMMAKRAGIPVEQLAEHYPNKQQVLNDLVGHHLHVREGIRAFTRADPGLSPLQSYLRELELLLEYMSKHRGTLQAYMENLSEIDPWIEDRIDLHRNQDVELLEKARDLKELPLVNATSLEAVLYGTLWELISEHFTMTGTTDFEAIPGVVSSRVLEPLLAYR